MSATCSNSKAEDIFRVAAQPRSSGLQADWVAVVAVDPVSKRDPS